VVNSEGKRFGNEAFFQEFVVKLREFDVVKKTSIREHNHFFLLFDSQFSERYPFANIRPKGRCRFGSNELSRSRISHQQIGHRREAASANSGQIQ